MPETQTPHYPTWIKPDVGGDASTWGTVLNTLFDTIDSVVWANQQAGLPIGSVAMFAGAAAPVNWLICDGSSLSTTGTYAALFGVLGYTYGGSGANFNLPNLQQKFPLGAGSNPLGQAGGSLSVPIAVGNLPPHAHPITDVAHSHTATQPAHTHPDPSHTHPASAADAGTHQHGPSNLMHFIGSGGTLGVGSSPFNVSQGITDPSAAPGVSVTVGYATANLQAAGNDAITVTPNGTGLSTTQNVGSGTPLSVVPPFVAINFIVRYQ